MGKRFLYKKKRRVVRATNTSPASIRKMNALLQFGSWLLIVLYTCRISSLISTQKMILKSLTMGGDCCENIQSEFVVQTADYVRAKL